MVTTGSLQPAYQGHKIYTGPYPLPGPNSTGSGKFTVDLVRQGVANSIDVLSVHLIGNVVISAGAPGTASGAYNPEGLLLSATLQLAPSLPNLVQVNVVGSRALIIDRAIQQKTFQRSVAIANTASSTQPVDVWYHLTFKRPHVKKGIEYALPMNRWTSANLQLVLGTVDQLFTGAATTWDLTGVNVEVWTDTDLDVFSSGGPPQIHGVELFDQVFSITASNPTFDINNLPQGVFYDTLVFLTEVSGALADGVINNIDIESGSRTWVPQGDNNAEYIREHFTRPLFYDPTEQSNLTGIYILPLRDGLWSRGIDARSAPIDIKLNVTYPGNPTNLHVAGRKLIPSAIRYTAYDKTTGKKSTVTERVPILK